MSVGDWNGVIGLATALIAREHPFAQAVTYEGLAFAAVMFIEGLRASFLPRRRRDEARSPGLGTVALELRPLLTAKPPFRPGRTLAVRKLKPKEPIRTVNRHAPMLPTIHRDRGFGSERTY